MQWQLKRQRVTWWILTPPCKVFASYNNRHRILTFCHCIVLMDHAAWDKHDDEFLQLLVKCHVIIEYIHDTAREEEHSLDSFFFFKEKKSSRTPVDFCERALGRFQPLQKKSGIHLHLTPSYTHTHTRTHTHKTQHTHVQIRRSVMAALEGFTNHSPTGIHHGCPDVTGRSVTVTVIPLHTSASLARSHTCTSTHAPVMWCIYFYPTSL